MKRYMAIGLALLLVASSTAAEAQLGGLLRKKAGEVLGKKPTTPPDTPAPVPDSPEPAPAPTSAGDPSPGTPAAPSAAVSPLEESALPISQSADEVLRDRIRVRADGDWEQLPFIPPAAAAAAYALSESAQVALVEKVGTALKALAMSQAFVSGHDAYIRNEQKAVDHGLTGIVTLEDALKRNDSKAVEAIQTRQSAYTTVEVVTSASASDLKRELDSSLKDWKARAGDPGRRDRAKYQKLVAVAEPLEALASSDEERFKRGYAVLLSIDNDGPDTEESLFALHRRETQELEQVAYDRYNLRGQLKRNLRAFVAIAGKVDFKAQTTEKDGATRFVNPAYERQGALWKACFRAGEAPTAAAVKLAKAWLAEL